MNSHARFIKLGLDAKPIIATRLLNAYVVSQVPNSLSYAQQLFDQVFLKDTVLWTSILSAYTRSGSPEKALKLFSQMLSQSLPNQLPNHFVYTTIARACGSTSSDHLQLGKSIHAHVIKTGFIPTHVVVTTAFLDMYAKWGEIECSRMLFDEMPQRNMVSWNAMISGYVQNEMEIHGFYLFYRLKCVEFCIPDEFAVATVLAACAWINHLKLGMQVHAYLVVVGFVSDCVNAICNMYFRCGEVSCAERVLRGREETDILKLIMIKGYGFNERYQDMVGYVACQSNVTELLKVDYGVIVSLLTASANLSLLRFGKQVHGLLVTLLGFHRDSQLDEESVVIIGCTLIDMYCKCANVSEARWIFNNLLPVHHVSCWNSMITGYIYNGLLEDAKVCFEAIPGRNVVSWTAMISGFVQCGFPLEGLKLLSQMYTQEDGITVQGNCFTFAAGLEACSLLTELDVGKQIHAKLTRTMVNADTTNVVVGTALVDMYSKSGNLDYAQIVFDWMEDRNVVSWTSMITGYAVHGLGSQALDLFQQMMEMSIEPNEVTFVSVLSACSHSGLVDEGMQYFKLMREKYSIVPMVDHYTCVIDLLGRAGRLADAWSLLEKMEDGDIRDHDSRGAIFGALLGACRLHGDMKIGVMVAETMLEKKQQVSETYITLSSIYAEAGMWNEVYRVRERWKREVDVAGEPGTSQILVQHGN